MRAPRITFVYKLVFLGSLFSVAISCGKKGEESEKKAKAPAITESQIGPDGKAYFTYEAAGSGPTYCKFASGKDKGEWYECEGSTQSYTPAPGEAVSFFTKQGKNGVITTKTLKNTNTIIAGPLDVDPAPINNTDVKIFGNNFQISLVNRTFQVPEGLYVTRYSYDSGLNGGLEVYEVLEADDPFKRATICKGNFPNVYNNLVELQSVPNGQAHGYCNSTPTREIAKYFSQNKMGFNQLEMVSEQDNPVFEYMTVSIFRSSKDLNATESRFEDQCNPKNQSIITPAQSYPLNLQQDYFPGVVPQTVQFHWCKKYATFGAGAQRAVYVGAFRSTRSFRTKDVIEFVRMADSRDYDDEFQFGQQSAVRVLNHLARSLPKEL